VNAQPQATPASLDVLPPRSVLLLDSDPVRLEARGAAMRNLGAVVACMATGARARVAWRPGSHRLVLIDFNGAGPGFNSFYQYAAGIAPDQSFAFYTDESPYLSRALPEPPVKTAEPAGEAVPLPTHFAGLIAEASQRIAAIRPLTRPAKSERRVGSLSFSEAVKAAERIVGGA
jgi:hypothetical protein